MSRTERKMLRRDRENALGKQAAHWGSARHPSNKNTPYVKGEQLAMKEARLASLGGMTKVKVAGE